MVDAPWNIARGRGREFLFYFDCGLRLDEESFDGRCDRFFVYSLEMQKELLNQSGNVF